MTSSAPGAPTPGAARTYPSPGPPGPLLALEVLHPDGSVLHAGAVGSGPAAALLPADEKAEGSLVDLLLLAPSAAERRSRAWTEEAAGRTSRLAPDGLLVVADPSRRLRRELTRLGLRPGMRLLHVPDLARSRYVMPLRGSVARYAVREVVPLGRAKRIAVLTIVLTGLTPRGTTSVLFQRPGARPPLDWLCAVDGSRTGCSAIVARRWRESGSTVVHRFTEAGRPDAIAKIGDGAAREAEALASLGPAARRAGAGVPRLLQRKVVGGRAVVFETPVAGGPAAAVVARSPKRAPDLLRSLSRWLESWSSTSAVHRAFTEDDAERHLLAPARRLGPSLGEEHDLPAMAEELCRGCYGTTMPFVAAHNDLTASNVMVERDGGLAVVDWEAARTGALPVGDLAYAIVDFAAAADGYGDRAHSHAACFGHSGPWSNITSELIGASVTSQSLAPAITALCLGACWLHHAVNELNEARDGEPSQRPFLEIVRHVFPPPAREAEA